MKNRYYEMKARALKIFPTYYHHQLQKLRRKFVFFISFFLLVWKVKEFIKGISTQKYDFFQKLKSMSTCLKNIFRQITPTSYRYFWTSFDYGISGFEYRNPSKIQCGEISQISLPLTIGVYFSILPPPALGQTFVGQVKVREGN